MIRIRTGAAWRHDPALRAALRRGAAQDAAAHAVVDALALEVDGVDLARGLAEGPLLPALEALLRGIARVVGGAPHASVPLGEEGVEILIRRQGPAAFLTVVALSRPSRVLAQDIEVDLSQLAAAALEASATFCRELDELLPPAAARPARPARALRAAARALRRTGDEPAGRRAPASRGTRRRRRGAPPAAIRLTLELHDDGALLAGYEGGRADLGSLLAPGRVVLRGPEGDELLALRGYPFLALRDLGPQIDALVAAIRRGDPRHELVLPRGDGTLGVDLAGGVVAVPGQAELPCPAVALARALAEAQVELGREAREANPRQAENAYVTELETAAQERLAQLAELTEGERRSPAPSARAAPARPPPQQPLGPGRLRRVAFRRTFRIDVGPLAGAGLIAAGGTAVIAGAAGIVAVERDSGRIRWRAEGAASAWGAGGAILAVRGDALRALSPRAGETRWTRSLPGASPTAAVALARGPVVLAERGALSALDPGSGRTLWRLEPPGAVRLSLAPFGGLLVVAADTGVLYGIDAAGRTVWRVRAPGPVLAAPVAAAGLCLAVAIADGGAALVAVDPAAGERRWTVPLDLAPAGPPIAWGRGLALAGALGGDPIVMALARDGAVAWTVAPPLAGPAAAVAAGPLLVARDRAGALVALGRDGRPRWSIPARPDHPPAGSASAAVARGTVIAPAGEGLRAVDVRTGEIVGALAGVAPERLSVDAALGVVAVEADGVATGWRIATHLSVV